MIKTIIIEDEIAGQELLKRNIREFFPECKIESVVDHVDKAIAEISAIKPDLVFVDIHIKGGTGFDVLTHFNDRNFEVIFITAYSQFAIQAIKEQALDYILKPINSNEFKLGVAKAIEKINSKTKVSNLISIMTTTGAEFINHEDIVFLEAEGSYTFIHLLNTKLISVKNIGDYEILLAKYSFFRTHHSFIVNTQFIEKFDKGRSGTLVMNTGHIIPVSQRKMKEFISILK